MKTVASDNVVMTELWRIPGDKSLSCLLGNMESCDTEEIVIGEDTEAPDSASGVKTIKNTSVTGNISVKKHDYRDYLVNNVLEAATSDYDTDDLIEDAKNFVTASKTRLVDIEVWREIDETRRQKRLSRKERNEKMSRKELNESKYEKADDLAFPPFVPLQLANLKIGYNVRVISGVSAKILTGVVK